jgi:homoserine O-acetyltransferase/O-succinyltransferase
MKLILSLLLALAASVAIAQSYPGSGAGFLTPDAGELFGAEQSLDAKRYYIILPDAIGQQSAARRGQ